MSEVTAVSGVAATDPSIVTPTAPSEALHFIAAALAGVPGSEAFHVAIVSAVGDPDAKGPGHWGWHGPPSVRYFHRGRGETGEEDPSHLRHLAAYVASEDAAGREVYWTPFWLPRRSRAKASATAPIRCLWADLDGAEPPAGLRPSITLETSPGRYQALWLLDQPMPALDAEVLNKRLTYATGADKSGWDLASVLRLPGTHNRKRPEPWLVRVVSSDADRERRYSIAEVEAFIASAGRVSDASPDAVDGDGPGAAVLAPPRAAGEPAASFTDAELIALARRAKNGAKFVALFDRGDISGYPSWSEAPMALAALIAFFSRDDGQVERIVASSALCADPERAKHWERDAPRVLAKIRQRGGPHFGDKAHRVGVRGDAPDVASNLFVWADELHQLPAREWLVEGLFGVGEVVGVVGDFQTAKSLLAQSLAEAVSSGSDWFGRRVTKPGLALYIAGEGSGGLGGRLEALAMRTGRPVSHRIAVMPKPLLLLDKAAVDFVLARIAEEMPEPPVIIFIDTLSRAIPGVNENQQEPMSLAVAAVDRLRDATGATVVLIHHVAKGERGGWRGSSVVPGALDALLMLERPEGSDRVSVSCLKQKDGAPFEKFWLAIVPLGPSAVLAAADVVINHMAASADVTLDTLERLGPNGATSTDWLKETNLPKRTFYNHRKALVESGRVRYSSPLYFVVTDAPDPDS